MATMYDVIIAHMISMDAQTNKQTYIKQSYDQLAMCGKDSCEA